MIKNSCFCFFLFCFFLYSNAAAAPAKQDSLLTILQLNNKDLQEQRLVDYIVAFFAGSPVNSLDAAKVRMSKLLVKYQVGNAAAINYFIESKYDARILDNNASENNLLKAIGLADKADDHYLLYVFFSHLGFLQTYAGNTIDAISSFRIANKEANTLNDPYLQVLIAINISDLYYRNNFYGQSLSYLNQAQSLITQYRIKQQRLKNVIYNNKAENYFRMGKYDSVKKYHQLLSDAASGTFKLYIFRNRTNYYLALLRRDYQNAIKLMLKLQKDPLYKFDNTDEQNLANAYYYAGELDSAKSKTERLLAGPAQNNHPEIKLHLYEVLGAIAENRNDNIQAVYNFKRALQQSKEHIARLTQVGDVSSQIKIDEMQNAYIQKEEAFKREKLWLIFTIIVSVLTIVTVATFYRNIKQKRYYEKLLFDAKKEELAFINSHQIRRHLSNILGIIDVIKESENKHEAYLQAEDNLLRAAENLDVSIKNISDKLDN